MPETPKQQPDWYKDAVIYQLHVKSFFDSNDDGTGDLPGLIAKLDYVAGLGVNTIWLLPFYPSPRRDDGYDIADYRGVHPDYGTVSDLRRLIRAAHARGLRVITELVVNHTSDQHPWFQRARRARPGSVARNYYVWSDTDRAYAGTRIIFCDTETSNWSWDPVAQAYYWHRFYSHQPDLNYDSPQVLREILNVLRFWLDMGVDGMRLDAVPYLVEREGTNNENLPETHAILRRIRAVVDAEYPGRMLLAEANQWPEDAQEYFGQGDECHMSFHFPLMPRMYMAIAQEDRLPIIDIMRQTPDIPDPCQWVIFLRNHDELTLEMVTSRERDYLWKVYAADPRARINLGIRRRLAPLLEGDRRRVELMNSLLLSMPGTPVLYYGDELGMGDNIHLGDRDGVRTPMQWSPDRNGGFSRADPERLQLPVLMGPLYGYEVINVESQQRNPHSLLNWTRRLLAQRAQTLVFGRGSLEFLYPGNRKILAYLRHWERTTILCVANLSATAQAVELPLQAHAGSVPVEMLGSTAFPAIGELPYLLTLPPYGFYWFDLRRDVQSPGWHVDKPEGMPELVTLVLRTRSATGLGDRARRLLASDALPHYLARQRWYAGRPSGLLAVQAVLALPDPAHWDGPDAAWALVSEDEDAGRQLSMPFVLRWDEQTDTGYPIARVRHKAEPGLLVDAFLEAGFMRALLSGLCRARPEPVDIAAGTEGAEAGGRAAGPKSPASPGGTLRYRRLAPALAPPGGDAEVRWFGGEQSNSSAIVDDAVVIKLLRQSEPGPNAEVEMSRWLTLAGYEHTPALLGTLEQQAPDERRILAVFHRYVPNEGDAWGWTLDYLQRTLSATLLGGADVQAFEESLSGYLAFARIMGQRLAELHAVFARAPDAAAGDDAEGEDAGRQDAPPQGDPANDPAGVAPADLPRLEAPDRARPAQTAQRICRQVEDAARRLARMRRAAPAERAEVLGFLREHRQALRKAIKRLSRAEAQAPAVRVHGDFHLGQVLVAQADAWLIDFEGEPLRDLASRRAADTVYKDLAGMLRSFDYAAAMAGREVSVPAAPAETGAAAAGTAKAGPPAAALDALLVHFRDSAGESFLAGYRDAAAAALRLPMEAESRLLLLAQLEKAAYEVCYEIAHRPDWAGVPAAALLRLAQAVLDSLAEGGSPS